MNAYQRIRTTVAAWRSGPSARRLLADGAWTIGGQLGAALGLVFGIRILTETLSPTVYGGVTLLMGIAMLGSNLFAMPVGQAALRFYPEAVVAGRLRSLTTALRWYFRTTTALLVLLILAGGALYAHARHVPRLEFASLAGVVVMDVARMFDTCFLNAARRQRPYAIWSAAEAWLRPLTAVGFVAWFGESVTHVLVGYAVASAVTYAVMHWGAVPSTPPAATLGDESAEIAACKESIWHYALPLVPLAMVTWVSSLSDRFLIGGLRGLAEAGMYAAAYGLASRPLVVLSMSLITTLRPIYYRAVSAGDRVEAARTLRIWVGLAVGGGLAGALAIFIARRLIVTVALSREYRAGAALLAPIALGYTFWSVSQAYATVCLAFKRPAYSTWIEVMGAVAAVVIGIPMILWRGGVGAAWAVPLYYGVEMLLARRLAHAVISRDGAGAKSVRG